MTEQFVTIGLICWGIGVACLLFAQLLGALAYDFRELRARRMYLRTPHSRQYRQRPLVSVVITTRNDAAFIADCLKSIVAGTYRKYEIIVVDQASTDSTTSIVRGIIKAYPKKTIRLVARRNQDLESKDLKQIVKRHVKGELIMLVSPQDTLAPQTLSQLVWRRNAIPGTYVWLPQLRLGRVKTTPGLARKYAQLLSYRAHKLASTIQQEPWRGTTMLLSHTSFLKLLQQTQGILSHPVWLKPVGLRYEYVHAAIVVTSGDSQRASWLADAVGLAPPARTMPFASTTMAVMWQGLRQAVANLHQLFRLSTPLVLSYFMYIALSLRQPTFLLVVWGGLAAVLVSAIWGDEQLKLRQKVSYLLGMPLCFGYLFVQTFAPYGVVTHRLYCRLKQLRNYGTFPFRVVSTMERI